jgi:hypothetical protein
MRRFAGAVIALAAVALSPLAQAQGRMPCDAFVKNPDGSWVALHSVAVPGAGRMLNVRDGAVFRPGAAFLGLDVAEQLDRDCPAEAAAPAAPPQVELPKLAGPSGFLDSDRLTCGQLASTYQEDADFLLAWYSGRASGAANKHMIDVPKLKQGIHNVIVYCKSNKDKLLSQAVDLVMK